MNDDIPIITISGTARAGKTTLAVLIQKALKDAGIESIIHNEDAKASVVFANQDERLKALSARLEGEIVSINQQQLRRGGM